MFKGLSLEAIPCSIDCDCNSYQSNESQPYQMSRLGSAQGKEQVGNLQRFAATAPILLYRHLPLDLTVLQAGGLLLRC